MNHNTEELDWQEYEEVTKYIYENLGAKKGIQIKGYGKDCKLEGKSGVKHQVDVVTQQFDGQRWHLTAIECKFLKKKVTKETVMKLHAIMEDCGVSSGIIVSKEGFTKDTLTYAEHKGIKLVRLWEADQADLKNGHEIRFGELHLGINTTLSRPIITSIDLGKVVLTDKEEIMAMNYSIMRQANGKQVNFKDCVKLFCDSLHEEDPLKELTKTYEVIQGKLFWKHKGEEIEVEKIIFTGFLSEHNDSSKVIFDLVDRVWLIMNEIFDKRRVTLSKSGMMYNFPPEA